MKTLCLFITITCITLTRGACYADPPAQSSGQQSGSSSSQPARQESATGVSSSAQGQSSPALPINTRPQSAPANNLSQPGLNHGAPAAKGGLTINRTGIQHAAPAKLPVGSGTTPASVGVLHSRSAGTASLGGLAPASAKTSQAVINGTAMKRKF